MEMQIQLVRNGEIAKSIDVGTEDDLRTWFRLFFEEDKSSPVASIVEASPPSSTEPKATKKVPKGKRKRKSSGLTQTRLYQYLLGKEPHTVDELCTALNVESRINMGVMAHQKAKLGCLRGTPDGEGGRMRYRLVRKGERRLAQLLREESA